MMRNAKCVILKKEYNLGSGSTVQRGINSLINKSIIDKEDDRYLINDIFLKLWLKTRMNP